MWRCAALDAKGTSWSSNLYRDKEQAALAAKEYCQQESDVHSTCTVNLISCTNLNERAP